MVSEQIPPPRSRLPLAFGVGSVFLILFQLTVLVPEWRLWRAGAVEVYSGQHRALVFGSFSGILMALALPLPVLLSHSPKLSRGRRYLLYALSLTLLCSSVALSLLR